MSFSLSLFLPSTFLSSLSFGKARGFAAFALSRTACSSHSRSLALVLFARDQTAKGKGRKGAKADTSQRVRRSIFKKKKEEKTDMFYSTQILAKKGPLGTIWIAAHLDRRLKRSQVFEANIASSVGEFGRMVELDVEFDGRKASWRR